MRQKFSITVADVTMNKVSTLYFGHVAGYAEGNISGFHLTASISPISATGTVYYGGIVGQIGKGTHGTGDIYASAFTGALMNDKSIYEAAKIAADYTVKCIINTQGDEDHWYGAKFETALGDLINMLK